MTEALEFLKGNWATITPIVTFLLGWFGSRWTMTKKERKDFEQKLFENGRDLMTAQHEKSQAFQAALKKYIDKEGKPTIDDFADITRAGETYFYQQKIVSDAILSGKVDPRSRDNTLAPSICDAVLKSLPAYYRSLKRIAEKNGFAYNGELQRKNYESLYVVVEKYGKGSNL